MQVDGVEYQRPRTRGDCEDGERPCPWASCRHHLYIHDIKPGRGLHGSVVTARQDLESMPETCALDVADRGGANLREIAIALGGGLGRERIRQIEVAALERAASTTVGGEKGAARRKLQEMLDEGHEVTRGFAALTEGSTGRPDLDDLNAGGKPVRTVEEVVEDDFVTRMSRQYERECEDRERRRLPIFTPLRHVEPSPMSRSEEAALAYECTIELARVDVELAHETDDGEALPAAPARFVARHEDGSVDDGALPVEDADVEPEPEEEPASMPESVDMATYQSRNERTSERRHIVETAARECAASEHPIPLHVIGKLAGIERETKMAIVSVVRNALLPFRDKSFVWGNGRGGGVRMIAAPTLDFPAVEEELPPSRLPVKHYPPAPRVARKTPVAAPKSMDDDPIVVELRSRREAIATEREALREKSNALAIAIMALGGEATLVAT